MRNLPPTEIRSLISLTFVERQCDSRRFAQSRPLSLVEGALPRPVHADSGGEPGEVENVSRRWLFGL